MRPQEKENEYRELFLTEAWETFTEINRLLTVLEKNHQDINTIQALFRLTHTLKGNATGMGFDKIAELTHVMEDFFGAMREDRMDITPEIFTSIFKAVDTLGQLIEAIKKPVEVKYLGIKTKLEVLIRKSQSSASQKDNNVQSAEYALPAEEAPVQQVANNNQHKEEEESLDEQEVVQTSVTFSDLVQVPVSKLDNLLNLVGELTIERDRIIATSNGKQSANEFARLNRISSDLQYSVMDVRLVQVGFLFNKFHRIVRDAAAKEGKQVSLKLEGTETEIDRMILQVISDSLIHLIRNAVGHGIEKSEVRVQAGKLAEGTLTLSASSESDTVIIRIQDDGAGIDPEKIKKKALERGIITAQEATQLSDNDLIMLIFEPGFSTMDHVTTISGRGVGMDVVKKALDSIGGTIQVNSEIGTGTCFTLSLPASMAVKSVLLFELDKQTYAFPLSYTESVVSLYKSDLHKAANGLITVHQEKTMHVVFLEDVFARSVGKRGERFEAFDQLHTETKFEVVVVSVAGKWIGFIVDKLLQQKEIIEKPLRKPVDQVSYVSGVSILGNGSVCLVLNVAALYNALQQAAGLKSVNA
jgi:two-component system chemotaxis sensor kinase CheA